MTLRIPASAEDHRIAWLAALAIAIHMLETALPSPLPGVKPGLANVITIVVLIQFGWRSAAWVSLLRVLCGGLLLGTFLSPTFFMSLSGALSSVLILWFAVRLPGTGFGPVGFSICAALAHMTGQFLMAYALFIPHPGLWKLLPPLLTVALLFGGLSGILAHMMLRGTNSETS